MRLRRRLQALLLVLALAVPLPGCFIQSINELYAPPQQSEEYYELQHAIEGIMTAGVSYAAPTGGVNRQPVQLSDLDGDGVDEAIVFLRAGGDKPLRVHIFDRNLDGVLENITTIEGDGAGFASAEYAQVDGEPGLEVILCRQVGDQVLQSMSVYALRSSRAVELMSASCSAYTTADLDADGNADLFLLRLDAEEGAGVAEYYRCIGGQIERDPEALMSSGAEGVRRILAGKVAGGVPAVFVASLYGEDSIITDIFALRDGSFVNITTAGAAGTSAETVRNYYVYGTDIDDDGVIELPQPVRLPGAGGEDSYWTIDWYELDLYGKRRRKVTTYHSYSGGWYVTLPDAWAGRLTISRGEEVSGVRGYVFSRWYDENTPPDPIFTIFAFSGDDSASLAGSEGRFPLAEKGDVHYAAALGGCAEARALSQEDLIEMFRFIRVDWNNGEVSP